MLEIFEKTLNKKVTVNSVLNDIIHQSLAAYKIEEHSNANELILDIIK